MPGRPARTGILAVQWTPAVALLGALWLGATAAQGAQPMSGDRPGGGDGPDVVGRGVFQIEMGVQVERNQGDAGAEDTTSAPTPLLRYGLTDPLELRLESDGFEYVGVQRGDDRSGGADVSLGAKWNFLGASGWMPKSTLLASLSFPTGAESITSGGYDPNLALLLGWLPADRFEIDVQLAFSLPSQGADDTRRMFTFTPVVTLEYLLADRLTGYVEFFSEITARGQGDTHILDGGFTYLLTEHILLDAWGGAGLTRDSPDFLAGAGFTVRF